MGQLPAPHPLPEHGHVAAGLFAAIPAVMAYNHFTMKVKSFASDLDDFSLEFLNIAERNFT